VSRIAFDSVTKCFPGGVVAVDDVSLTIKSGEFIFEKGFFFR